MRKFLTLTCVLFKSGTLFRQGAKGRRNLSLIIVAAVTAPLLAATTAMLMNAYPALQAANLVGTALAGMMTSACAAMVVLGIFYVMSTYYFSDDTVALLSLPIPSHLILAAKFAVVTAYQYLLEAMIVLPGVVAFGVRDGTPYYWIASAVVMLTLPLIPTVICSVVSILLMAFGNFFKNKDRVKLVSGLLGIAAAVGINVAMQSLGGSLIPSGAPLSGGVMERAAALYPVSIAAVNGILSAPETGLLWLALFLIISAAAVALFLLLGNALYLRGVVGLTQSVADKRRANARPARRRAPDVSLALREWRTLCRTPSYLLNCVLGAFLFPPLLVALLGFSLRDLPMPGSGPMALSILVLAACFMGTMNMASATAVSREGKNAYVARYLPVPYRTQIRGKLLPGLLLSLTSLILMLLPAAFLLKLDGFTLLCGFVIGGVAIAAFNMLGLFVDIVFPKLDWDDETAAVKRNLNTGILMFGEFLLLGLPVYLVSALKLGTYAGAAFLLLYNLALLAAAAALLFGKGPALYAGETRAARPAKKPGDIRRLVTSLGTAILLTAAAVLLFMEFTASADVQVTPAGVKISAGIGEGCAFAVSDIREVYLSNALPPTSGRVGFAAGAQKRGSFNVEGLGRGHVYTQTGEGPFLYILLKDGGFAILNFKDPAKTNGLYGELKRYGPQ